MICLRVQTIYEAGTVHDMQDVTEPRNNCFSTARGNINVWVYLTKTLHRCFWLEIIDPIDVVHDAI